MINNVKNVVFTGAGIGFFGGFSAYQNILEYWYVILGLVLITLIRKNFYKIPYFNKIFNKRNLLHAFALSVSVPMIASVIKLI